MTVRMSHIVAHGRGGAQVGATPIFIPEKRNFHIARPKNMPNCHSVTANVVTLLSQGRS
jgi:hypothetical protein